MCLPCLPSFPHSVEFLANTIRFYIICKDYDSINQHSHPSTTTPPTPTGGGAGNHDHPRGGGVGLPRAVPYIYTLKKTEVASESKAMRLKFGAFWALWA